MNKKIIIVIGIIIIVAIIAALFLNAPSSKEDTKIKMLSKSSLKEGSSIKIELTDLNNTPMDNKTIVIKIINKKGKVDEYSVKTDKNGKAKLKLNKTKPGTYTVNFTYDGDDAYNSSNLSKKIKIIKKVKAKKPESTIEESAYEEPSTSSNELNYDEQLNVYYDSNGMVVDPDGQHGQSVGFSYSEVRDTYDRWESGELEM